MYNAGLTSPSTEAIDCKYVMVYVKLFSLAEFSRPRTFELLPSLDAILTLDGLVI